MTSLDLDTLPVGVKLPLLDCIKRCHKAPPTCWTAEAYKLIGRSDIAMTHQYSDTMTTPTVEMQSNVDGMNLDLEVCWLSDCVGVNRGCGCLQVLKLRFPKDLRAKEVRRMLQSAEPIRVALVQQPEVRYGRKGCGQ